MHPDDAHVDAVAVDAGTADVPAAAGVRSAHGAVATRARALAVAAAALAVALAAVLWAWGLPLGNDAATHVFLAWVRNHHGDPAFDYARYYTMLDPPSTRVFHEVQRALEPWLGWQTAWRVHTVLLCELWAFGFFVFVRTLAPQRAWVGLLGFPLALQGTLWLGLVTFTWSCALAWWALAWALRAHERPWHWPAISVALWIAASAHVLPAALGGALVLLVAWARAPRDARARTLAIVVVVGVPAFTVWLRVWGLELESLGEPQWPEPIDRVLFLGARFMTGPRWRHVLATVLVLLAVLALRNRRASLTRAELVLVAAGLLLVGVTPALPDHAAGWHFAGLRLVPLGAGLLLAFLPVDLPRWRVPAASCAALFTIASLAWGYVLHADLRRALAPALAGLSAPAHPARRVALVARDLVPEGRAPVDGFAPLLHIGNLYGIARGGMDPYGHHGVASIHHLELKPEYAQVPQEFAYWRTLWTLTGPERAPALNKVLGPLSAFEELILVGWPADFTQAKARGWTPVFENEVLFLGAYAGCDGAIEVTGAAADVGVELGWWPTRTPLHAARLAPPQEGRTRAPLPAFGCGEVWAFVHAPGARCAEAPDGGPVRATFAAGTDNVLRCTLVAADAPAPP